ncbi:iron chelate uptake ABC transporter family permease subunit, partial [Streptomyces sp. SID6139]|nr:iron chelate uptake ABC transporter family permease subunit [Streptomyces sp. SID6139]
DDAALGRMRFWTVGSLASASETTIVQVLPFLAVGSVLALGLARPLNAVTMGDDTARALGAHLNRTRALAMLAATVLCGAATAACGPIVFVGLMVPHAVRSFTGPDLRWILPYAAVLSPVLLLGADVIGRVVARPAELQVGIVTAVIGGPVFIFLVRRRRTAQL